MNSWIAFGLILGLLFVGSVMLDYALYTHNGNTQSATAVDGAKYLNLTMSLNATSISKGQSVEVTIEESNVLNTTNTVNASDNWPLSSLGVGPCGNPLYPMGFAIYQGYYTASNIQQAAPLSLYMVMSCISMVNNVSSCTFAPLSDNATINISPCSSNICLFLYMSMNAGFVGNGYWSYGFHTDFPSGVYTVAGGDEWGQLVILHFRVI